LTPKVVGDLDQSVEVDRHVVVDPHLRQLLDGLDQQARAPNA
jgi:hypothetical protein